MNQIVRKKSPRAPSLALDDAIDKALKIYDKERRNGAPADVVAQHIGYKNASNGTALSAFASLKYYGLLDKVRDGVFAVAKDVEEYKFAPNEQMRQAKILKWLKSPPLFTELLEKHPEGLPSDATLKFDLIQRGFSPLAANACMQAFIRSVDYAHFFEQSTSNVPDTSDVVDSEITQQNESVPVNLYPSTNQNISSPMSQSIQSVGVPDSVDRIPVRLAGGRRAWIEIPTPFYVSDKERLKAQIDLLLADDEIT